MFYASVRHHPLVESNWHVLIRGEKIQTRSGSIYVVLRKVVDQRSFIIRDDKNDLIYFVHGKHLNIVKGGGGGTGIIRTIDSPKPRKGKSIAELVSPEDSHYVERLQEVLDVIMRENKRKTGWLARTLRWVKDPAAKLFLLGVIIYGILTTVVLVNDYLKH